MANNFRRFTPGIQLIGQNSTSPDAAGEIRYNSATNIFEYFDGTALRVPVSRNLAETLQNKTLTDTVSITGTTTGALTITSGAAQNLSLQSNGADVLVEGLVINGNVLTGDSAAQLTIQSASNQNLLLRAQGSGNFTIGASSGSIILSGDGNNAITIDSTGTITFPQLTVSTPLKLDGSGNVVAADIDLTTDVTGVLPVANGGTGSAVQNYVDLTTPQTVGGAKTFTSNVIINPVTNQLVLGVTNTTTINSVAPAASRVYTIPDAGTDTSFIMGASNQTVGGTKTFSSAVVISPVSNQLVLGTTNTTTISATAPSASQTITIPDPGASAEFIISTTNQNIGARKNFTSQIDVTGFQSFTGSNDAASTGSNATLPDSTRSYVRLTNAGLVSVAGITPTDSGRILILVNATGNAITLVNDASATASMRILTGTGGDISLANNATINLIYDGTTSRWRAIGGAGNVIGPASVTDNTLVRFDGTTGKLLKQSATATSIAEGGTGQTTQTAAFDALAPTTTKGDVIVHNGSDNIRVAKSSSDDFALVTKDSEASGLRYMPIIASDDIINARINTSVAANALTISLISRATGTASATDPIRVAFRNASSSSGEWEYDSITSNMSLIISSGSTLGHVSGVAEYIYVYLMQITAGSSWQLCASSTLRDEGVRWGCTAEGGAGGADSRTVLYGTSTEASKPIRLIARIRITEATAGTWASNSQEIAMTPFNQETLVTGIGPALNNNSASFRCEGALIAGSAVSPSVTNSSSSWISSITRNGTGDYTLNLATGVFSNAVWASVTVRDGTVANQTCVVANLQTVGPTSIRYVMNILDDGGGSTTTVTRLDADAHILVLGYR